MPQMIEVPGQGMVEFPDGMSDADIVSAIKRNSMNLPKKEKASPSTMSRVQAGATGINKGFFSDLLGLPVDTVTNVADLGKAGIGYLTSKVTGAPPPEWTTPTNRANVVGSSEWLANGINKVGLGDAINNPNPDDQVSRVLHMGGRVAGQSIVPARNVPISIGQNAANMAKGAISGMAAGAVGEVAPEWAGVAGMMPQAAMAGGSAAVRQIVRGGEAGRQKMAQRIQDLQNGGIDAPSAGLASGNKFIMGIENLLSQTPGSHGLYEAAREKNIAGMQGRANALRDSISTDYGPLAAGEAIQGSIKGPFIDRFKTTQGNLYDAVDKLIPGGTKAPVKNTANALSNLTSGIEGAPNIGDRFINGRISDINDAFRIDTGLDRMTGVPRQINTTIPGDPSRPNLAVTRTIDPRGQFEGETQPKIAPNSVYGPRVQQNSAAVPQRTTTITIPGTNGRQPITVNRVIDPYASIAGEGGWKPPETPTLPYTAVSKLRTEVGNELNGNMLTSDVPRSQWKQLYAGLSGDIGETAANAGQQAVGAWNRANMYTKKGINRIEELQSLADRSTPESAFTAVSNSLDAGPTTYKRLRGALTPEARQKVVATVIDELGAAKDGQQNAAGDVWSPRTFLTNYNRMDSGARGELFKRIPGGTGMANNLTDIAKTAEMVGDASKVWANPSGTAQALSNRATLGTLFVGSLFNFPAAAATAGGLVAANQASQRLLLNPKFVQWLAKAPNSGPFHPEQAQAYAQRLIANARMTNDKQFQQDVAEYLQSIEQSN